MSWLIGGWRLFKEHWPALAIFVLIFAFFAMLLTIDQQRYEIGQAQERNKTQQQELNQQSAIISQQAFQFQRANEISATAHRYGINTDAATQEKEIEYRTILKNQPTCDLAVPAAIAGGLLNYTHRLRAGAVSSDTGSPDGSSLGAITPGPLTYCQAVLWIDPLLSAIDKANNQLRSIRQLDDARQVKK
ncbi:hypothetical protein [Serratia rhizosphaerae]|uniref:hypothetical protein n=1 Tax=Serratia rhizosphaerae TaxID=2597702 RepID=UPI00191631BE|nr:hypothetical protein [Serratia rhizosphaerae]